MKNIRMDDGFVTGSKDEEQGRIALFLIGLTLLLAALKAWGVVDWAWWEILLPMYAPPIVIIVIAFIMAVFQTAWQLIAEIRHIIRINRSRK